MLKSLLTLKNVVLVGGFEVLETNQIPNVEDAKHADGYTASIFRSLTKFLAATRPQDSTNTRSPRRAAAGWL